MYFHDDYDKQLGRLANKKERSALIINDPKQSMFLFLDKHHIQVKIYELIWSNLIFFFPASLMLFVSETCFIN